MMEMEGGSPETDIRSTTEKDYCRDFLMFETLEDIWEFLCVHFCILGILQFRLPGKIRIEAMLTVREKKKLKFSSNT